MLHSIEGAYLKQVFINGKGSKKWIKLVHFIALDINNNYLSQISTTSILQYQ